MSKQDYSNHVRFFAPHHFVFYPIALALIVLSFYMGNKDAEQKYIWWFLGALTILVTWLSFMLRQHYAMTLQNRIVRLEVAHRYFVLAGKDFTPIQDQLKDAQIFALRFASDEEFITLIDKTQKNQLTATDIKKDIKNWKADNHRV